MPTKKANSSLDLLDTKLKGVAGQSGLASLALEGIGAAGPAAGVAVAATAVVALGAAAVAAANKAGDLSEAVSATRQVFGEGADEIERFASNAPRALGLTETAALQAATGFGSLFKGLGATSDEAATAAGTLTSLAGDLASFKNLSGGAEEATQKLRSGLVGETEALRSLDIIITEASVKQKAYTLGLAATGAELTEGQKVQARYALILEQTAEKQGDFERTSEGLANQQRILTATLDQTETRLGTAFLPTVTAATASVTGFATALDKLAAPLGGIGPSLATAVSFAFPLIRAGGELNQIFGETTDTLTDYGDTLDLAASQTEAHASATRDLEKAYQDEEKALNSVRDAQLASINAEFGLEKANRATHEAIKDYNRTFGEAYLVNKGKDVTLNDANTSANLKLREATIRQAEALAKLRAEQLEANGQTLTAEERNTLLANAIRGVAKELDPSAPVRKNLVDYSNQIAGIPSNIVLEITADTRQAEENIRRLNVQLAEALRLDDEASEGSRFINGKIVTSKPGRREHGGPVSAGGGYIVGEAGPEFFVPRQSGTIIPNSVGGASIAIAAGAFPITIAGDATDATARRLVGVIRSEITDALTTVVEMANAGVHS